MEVVTNLSVEVSYKKQFLLGVLLLFVIIIAIEGIVRTYDYFNPNCMFIGSEVFQDVDFELKRAICHANDDIIWSDQPFLHLRLGFCGHVCDAVLSGEDFPFQGGAITRLCIGGCWRSPFS